MGQISPKAAARALLMYEDTYATVLITLFLDTYHYTDENGRLVALGWHPETIRRELERDFDVQLPKESLDKICAAITILTTNFFYKDVDRFIELCNILSGDDFQPDEFDPADPAEVMWGVAEAMILYPPNDDPEDTEFGPDVRGYIEEVLKQDGILKPPDVLRLGLNPQTASKIDEEYADDPEMYNAIWDQQQGKNAELEECLRDGLLEMAVQLRLLPLQHGSVKGVMDQLKKVLGEIPEEVASDDDV